MIEATKAYQTSDGATFSDLDAAKKHELEESGFTEDAASAILEKQDCILAILKLKPRKTRAVKAAKKAKAAKVVVAAA